MVNIVQELLSQINVKRLQDYVRKIEGLRHGWENYDTLEAKAGLIEKILRSFNLKVDGQKVPFHERTYRNVIATLEGIDPETDRILLGAHYDAAWGSPGADDNASGVAVMLETAGILSELKFRRTIEFVAFTLEEPQPQTIHFLIGSNYFSEHAKRTKKRYRAVVILESVGYTDEKEGSQITPLFIRIPVPDKGIFLGVIANRKSKKIMDEFCSASKVYVPELILVPYKVPLSGRIIPETRFSDHASFWNHGYPAIMLTDTAMFRNPHYHTCRDRYETLDFNFMCNVTKAVISYIMLSDHIRQK